jgi:hypothetical protein
MADGDRIIIPRGIRVAHLIDEDPPVATLTFETDDGDIVFAVNRQVSDILKKAIARIDEKVMLQ